MDKIEINLSRDLFKKNFNFFHLKDRFRIKPLKNQQKPLGETQPATSRNKTKSSYRSKIERCKTMRAHLFTTASSDVSGGNLRTSSKAPNSYNTKNKNSKKSTRMTELMYRTTISAFNRKIIQNLHTTGGSLEHSKRPNSSIVDKDRVKCFRVKRSDAIQTSSNSANYKSKEKRKIAQFAFGNEEPIQFDSHKAESSSCPQQGRRSKFTVEYFREKSKEKRKFLEESTKKVFSDIQCELRRRNLNTAQDVFTHSERLIDVSNMKRRWRKCVKTVEKEKLKQTLKPEKTATKKSSNSLNPSRLKSSKSKKSVNIAKIRHRRPTICSHFKMKGILAAFSSKSSPKLKKFNTLMHRISQPYALLPSKSNKVLASSGQRLELSDEQTIALMTLRGMSRQDSHLTPLTPKGGGSTSPKAKIKYAKYALKLKRLEMEKLQKELIEIESRSGQIKTVRVKEVSAKKLEKIRKKKQKLKDSHLSTTSAVAKKINDKIQLVKNDELIKELKQLSTDLYKNINHLYHILDFQVGATYDQIKELIESSCVEKNILLDIFLPHQDFLSALSPNYLFNLLFVKHYLPKQDVKIRRSKANGRLLDSIDQTSKRSNTESSSSSDEDTMDSAMHSHYRRQRNLLPDGAKRLVPRRVSRFIQKKGLTRRKGIFGRDLMITPSFFTNMQEISGMHGGTPINAKTSILNKQSKTELKENLLKSFKIPPPLKERTGEEGSLETSESKAEVYVSPRRQHQSAFAIQKSKAANRSPGSPADVALKLNRKIEDVQIILTSKDNIDNLNRKVAHDYKLFLRQLEIVVEALRKRRVQEKKVMITHNLKTMERMKAKFEFATATNLIDLLHIKNLRKIKVKICSGIDFSNDELDFSNLLKRHRVDMDGLKFVSKHDLGINTLYRDILVGVDNKIKYLND